MSLHANNTETEARLRRQRVHSSLASVVIGVLAVALLMLVLALILLSPFLQEVPTIVAYKGANSLEERIDPRRTFSQMRSKPASPSSAMSRVIAANTSSPTAVPVPEIDVDAVAEGFGMGDDFGDGWGGGGDGSGFGGGTTFFRQEVRAQRVAYVIDYSLSMRGQRESLMRNELKKSVEKLTLSMQYQLIFFAGPAWVAGDEVDMAAGKKRTWAVVKDGSGEYRWTSQGKAHDWEPKGKKREADWITVGASTRNKSVNQIENTALVWGTHWEPALEMAMAMDPAPEVIFFMTDGVTGGDALKAVRTLGAKAKAREIVINTVAMMEPKAEEAMKELAKRTGGQFSIVRPGGKVEIVPVR